MQKLLVVLFMLGALVYLGWRLYARLNQKPGCDTECGCSTDRSKITGKVSRS